MRTRLVSREEGQVLIQVALFLVVLLAFGALAIDTGHVYGERRLMQNAADAAALAGARELCLNNGPEAAIAAGENFLQLNTVAAANIQPGDISVDNNIVRATARTTSDTFLAGVIGFTEVDVAASAASACGAATSACGLWPVAFDLDLWPEEEDIPCGQHIIVWSDDAALTCEIDGEERPICDCYDCDLNNNGEDDIAVFTDTTRGWLDMEGAGTPLYTDSCPPDGCGTNAMDCYFRSGSGAQIPVGTCIAGNRGVRAALSSAINSRAGHTIGVPLFSDTNCGVDNNCTGHDADSYLISAIGCIEVVGWHQNFTLRHQNGQPSSTVRGFAVEVIKACDSCFTACGSTTGTPAEPWEARAVNLIE